MAWLVDIGDIEPVLAFLQEKNLAVAGVFLTHAHFDHIYELETLTDKKTECKAYCTGYCKKALISEKLNMSKYHGTPINYCRDNVAGFTNVSLLDCLMVNPKLCSMRLLAMIPDALERIIKLSGAGTKQIKTERSSFGQSIHYVNWRSRSIMYNVPCRTRLCE